MTESDVLVALELGGSSRQTCVFVNGEAALLVDDGSVTSPGARYGLATPGVIRGGRLYVVRKLGIADGTTVQSAGALPESPAVALNDGAAAAAGEWFLRGHGSPPQNLLYFGIGTGVGSARAVDDAWLEETYFGHSGEWSTLLCPGCDRVGCLDTVISGRVLPNPLSSADERNVAGILRLTIERFAKDAELVVLAGGVVKTNPGILRLLEEDGTGGVQGTAAPPGFKSAAPFGLLAVHRGMLELRAKYG